MPVLITKEPATNRIVRHMRPEELLAQAQDPDTATSRLARIAAVSGDYHSVLAAVGVHPRCPGPWLSSLSRHPNPEIRRAVASNPQCPFDLLEHLSNNTWTTSAVAANPRCPHEILQRMVAHSDIGTRCVIAARYPLAVDLAMALAADPDVGVRRDLAIRSDNPPEVWIALAHDQHRAVRQAALDNDALPPHIKAVLVLGR